MVIDDFIPFQRLDDLAVEHDCPVWVGVLVLQLRFMSSVVGLSGPAAVRSVAERQPSLNSSSGGRSAPLLAASCAPRAASTSRLRRRRAISMKKGALMAHSSSPCLGVRSTTTRSVPESDREAAFITHPPATIALAPTSDSPGRGAPSRDALAGDPHTEPAARSGSAQRQSRPVTFMGQSVRQEAAAGDVSSCRHEPSVL